MPSSLAVLLPPALGSSPHPPVSVCGTGAHGAIAAFPGGASARFATLCSLRVARRAPGHGDFPPCRAPRLRRSSHSRPAPAPRVPASSVHVRCRNLSLLSIGYASLPRLRPRLPQGRSASPWKPWIFGRGDSHPPLATHSGILPPCASTAPCGAASPAQGCSPTGACTCMRPAASAACLSPGHFRRAGPRLVSCYALFECMAASEPTS